MTAVEIHEDATLFAVREMGVRGQSHEKPVIVLERPEWMLFRCLSGPAFDGLWVDAGAAHDP